MNLTVHRPAAVTLVYGLETNSTAALLYKQRLGVRVAEERYPQRDAVPTRNEALLPSHVDDQAAARVANDTAIQDGSVVRIERA